MVLCLICLSESVVDVIDRVEVCKKCHEEVTKLANP